jgi:hypothetical protein
VIVALMVVVFCALAACQTTTAVKTQCLPMKTYTLTEEQAVGAAVMAEPTNPMVAFITDYGTMRAANRACLAKH